MKTVIKDKDGNYIIIKRSIQEEDITIGNLYTPKIGIPQRVSQILTIIRGEINYNTIIVGDVDTFING